MLSTDAFAEWSAKVVLFLHNTSKVAGEPNPRLLYEMGGVGFPTVSFLDEDGRLLQQVGHVTPVEELEKAHAGLMEWKALRQKVEAGGDEALRRELFLKELAMGNRPYAEMLQRRGEFEFPDAEAKDIEQQLVNIQFSEILRATDDGSETASGKKFVEMWRAGRIPDTTTTTLYWKYQFDHAAAERNVALFAELITWLKEHRQDDPRLARYVRQLEQQLEQLKSAR